jgi:hypothetical protein
MDSKTCISLNIWILLIEAYLMQLLVRLVMFIALNVMYEKVGLNEDKKSHCY